MKYGRYRGFTSLGIVFQTMDNTHLRRALGMKANQTGVLLNRIQPTTSTAKVRAGKFAYTHGWLDHLALGTHKLSCFRTDSEWYQSAHPAMPELCLVFKSSTTVPDSRLALH